LSVSLLSRPPGSLYRPPRAWTWPISVSPRAIRDLWISL